MAASEVSFPVLSLELISCGRDIARGDSHHVLCLLQMPQMHKGRGSLMAVIHDGSPWAIGGRDADYHSSTERLDLASGQWVIGPEMHMRRFACAGCVLGSGIIVTGGFDGLEYQRGAERLDPRMKRSVKVRILS